MYQGFRVVLRVSLCLSQVESSVQSASSLPPNDAQSTQKPRIGKKKPHTSLGVFDCRVTPS